MVSEQRWEVRCLSTAVRIHISMLDSVKLNNHNAGILNANMVEPMVSL